MSKYKLIIVYGSSPGAGKSTLSSRLHQQLQQHHLPVQWLYEDDVVHLDLFAPVVAQMHGESTLGLTDACLVATTRLVDAYAADDTIVITDSILPYFDWLFAVGHDVATLREFSAQLQALLSPMHPLVVYLQADVAMVLQRAVDQRGEEWLRGLVDFMNQWSANKAHPIRYLAEAIAYFQATDQQKVQLLLEWVGDVLWLDSAAYSLEECTARLLNNLELTPVDQPPQIPTPDFRCYAGNYVTSEEDPPDGKQRLTITLNENALWVDLYWPNGCRLVAEDEHTFQLEDTSHRLVFIEPLASPNRCVHYYYRGKLCTYRELESGGNHATTAV